MAIVQLLQSFPALFVFLCTVVGLAVGSFLNVVIHRLPIMLERQWRRSCAELRGEELPAEPPFNLMTPRSRCPACGHPISALENIPVVSWLLLKGRCSACAAAISPRYPLVEALCGLLSGFIAWRFGLSLAALGALVFAWALIAAAFIDLSTQLLPDAITLPLLWAGLLLNTASVFAPPPAAVLGAAAGYGALWAVYWAFKLATGKEGMGHGDFKLAAALGAWLGWKMLPLVILLSSLIGALAGVALIVAARHNRGIPIPFGPYLAGGGLIALFWGEPLVEAYLRMLSL